MRTVRPRRLVQVAVFALSLVPLLVLTAPVIGDDPVHPPCGSMPDVENFCPTLPAGWSNPTSSTKCEDFPPYGPDCNGKQFLTKMRATGWTCVADAPTNQSKQRCIGIMEADGKTPATFVCITRTTCELTFPNGGTKGVCTIFGKAQEHKEPRNETTSKCSPSVPDPPPG